MARWPERIGLESPPRGERVPNVDFAERDLQDSSSPVSVKTVVRDYAPGGPKFGGRVYPAWVAGEDMPPSYFNEEEQDWSEFQHRGRPWPPVKLYVYESGEMSIADGNHRAYWWSEQGYTHMPCWVIDARRPLSTPSRKNPPHRTEQEARETWLEMTDHQVGALFEARDEEVDHWAAEFKEWPTRQPWSVVPAARLMKIWKDTERLGFVRDIKGLQKIVDRVVSNVLRLWINSDILVGSTSEVEGLAKELGIDPDNEDLSDYIGGRYSDFAMAKLIPLCGRLLTTPEPMEQLVLVDRILNITHYSNDLAAMFVEGGSRTLDELSGGIPPERRANPRTKAKPSALLLLLRKRAKPVDIGAFAHVLKASEPWPEIVTPDLWSWRLARNVPIKLLEPPTEDDWRMDPAVDDDEVEENISRYETIKGILKAGGGLWPIVVSEAGFILDGYHRLAAAYSLNPKATVDVLWASRMR
jgi:hypothetical protein